MSSKEKINKISDGDTNDAAMYQPILEQLAYKMYEEKRKYHMRKKSAGLENKV